MSKGDPGQKVRWVARELTPSDPPIPMPTAIWNVLCARGMAASHEIEKILRPRLHDMAHPFSLDQMDLAVRRLVEAHKAKEPILIYGDYDLDGTPGLALLREGFEKLGFARILSFQPSRMNDGYGLHAHHALRFAKEGVRLVVTVDVGITDIEAVDELNRAGVDVIVTDHHLPKDRMPNAFAVVNPNKGECGSSLQHLCGTGVAFYLILAVRMALEKESLLREPFDPKTLLDLFALATITDMVPLVRENRVLVKHGLKILAKTERPGLRLLLRELGLYGRELTAHDIGFRLAPKLNALTRLEDGISAYDVLTANAETANELVERALQINEKRRALQEHAGRVAKDLIRQKAPQNDRFIFVYSREFHPGVISLIANDLMASYQLPAFVGAVRDNGHIVGSARAPRAGDMNLQAVFQDVNRWLVRSGGHRHAAGFELKVENADGLHEALGQTFATITVAKQKDGECVEKTIFYDAEIRLTDFSHDFMAWHDVLEPFGPGFESPAYLMRGLRVRSARKLKNKFMRYSLTDGMNEIEAPWFENPIEFEPGTRIDLLFEPQWNHYNGRRTLQAKILAARPSVKD